MKDERRQYKRLRVIDAVYAALGRNYSKVGQVYNISIGGLSFEYFSGEALDHADLIVDIFTENSIFGLYNLPCALVHDNVIKTPKVKSQFADHLTTRRCGIKFGQLGKNKQKQLAKFLSVHTANFAK